MAVAVARGEEVPPRRRKPIDTEGGVTSRADRRRGQGGTMWHQRRTCAGARGGAGEGLLDMVRPEWHGLDDLPCPPGARLLTQALHTPCLD